MAEEDATNETRMTFDETSLNGTWADIDIDIDSILPPELTHEEIRSVMKEIGYHSLMAFGRFASVIFGPVLWSICIAGAGLNLFVIMAEFLAAVSGASISIAAISINLIIRASSLLFLHDLLQSKYETLGNLQMTTVYIDYSAEERLQQVVQ